MSFRSKILIAIQFICFGYFAFFQKIVGSGTLLILQLAGLVLCLWSIYVMQIGNFNVQPEVKTGARLISAGPYKLIRNPMYTGLLIIFSIGLVSNFTWISLFFFILLCMVFVLKIRDEERYLEISFGKQYSAYKRKTFRMIPYVWWVPSIRFSTLLINKFRRPC